MNITDIASIISVLGLAAVIYFFSKLNNRLDQMQQDKDGSRDTMTVQLHQRIDNLNKSVGDNMQKVTESMLQQLNSVTQQVDRRIHSTNQDWLKSSKEIRRTIDNNIRTVNQVVSKLSQMEESNKRIYDVGKDISSLQEILKAPKLRGTLGELFLGDLLSQIVPHDRYRIQYAFKSGAVVDAVLKLRDGHLVSIDAKFPLESFKRILESQTEEEKKVAKKQFVDSVKRRIDEIATKYIVADEGTLDFALMYIPAENVYYETIVRGEPDKDLMQYAYAKRVIPVSPNNLYVYLQTIALGLRGMQIEERAREILSDLARLNTDFGKVTDSYEILGKHLASASSRYDETTKILNKFGTKVEQIESKTETEGQMKLVE